MSGTVSALTTAPLALPRYNPAQTYDWNYEHAPESPVESAPMPAVPGAWRYAGLPAASPLAIAAGPLLNGRWVRYYAALGFDILTYKTVRSGFRACYPLPNLQPIDALALAGNEPPIRATPEMAQGWAVSFGMPSRSPDCWRADVAATRKALPREKLLSVSVVATPQPGWSIEAVAHDFARCAQWAVESGADCIEANFSCPNVASCDGQLYQQPELAGLVAATIRSSIGRTPLLIKIGQITDVALATALIDALTPSCQSLAMVNCIPATVTDARGNLLFNGERRGIAGPAIRSTCLEQIRLFRELIVRKGSSLTLIGVGGIGSAGDVTQFLNSGCEAVQIATAAMLKPEIGREIRTHLAKPDLN